MQEIQNILNTMEKRNEIGKITLGDFKTYYNSTTIKIMWYWHKARHIDQWNRNETPQ